MLSTKEYINFNSTLVRLKGGRYFDSEGSSKRFQFYISTIKGIMPLKDVVLASIFQFYISTIKGFHPSRSFTLRF